MFHVILRLVSHFRTLINIYSIIIYICSLEKVILMYFISLHYGYTILFIIEMVIEFIHMHIYKFIYIQTYYANAIYYYIRWSVENISHMWIYIHARSEENMNNLAITFHSYLYIEGDRLFKKFFTFISNCGSFSAPVYEYPTHYYQCYCWYSNSIVRLDSWTKHERLDG